MTMKHVFTTPYGGREIWRDGKPFAILAKPAGAPLDSTYYIQLSAFGHLSAAAPDLLEALEAIAPKDGPELARSEGGGYECPHCGGFWREWTSTFAHRDDCAFVKARKAIAKATEKAV